MTLTLFIGLWLCSYRLTRFIVKDSLIKKQRTAFYKRFPPNDYYASLVKAQLPNGLTYWEQEPAPTRKISKLGVLFSCSWCCGFWCAGATVGVVALFDSVPLPLLWWGATATAVGLTAGNLD